MALDRARAQKRRTQRQRELPERLAAPDVNLEAAVLFHTLQRDATDQTAKLMLDLDYMSGTLKIVGIRTRRLQLAQLVAPPPVGAMTDSSNLAERQP